MSKKIWIFIAALWILGIVACAGLSQKIATVHNAIDKMCEDASGLDAAAIAALPAKDAKFFEDLQAACKIHAQLPRWLPLEGTPQDAGKD